MKINRVLLIVPPDTRPADMPREKTRIGLTAPIGLGYIAAVLLQEGLEVKILDCSAYSQESWVLDNGEIRYEMTDWQILEQIALFNPDMVGVSCLFSNKAYDAHNVCKIAKYSNPNIITVMGGAHPTALPVETIADQNLDYVILGEGEYAMRNLIRDLNNGHTAPPTYGAVPIPDLDKLPFPARHLMPMEKYLGGQGAHSGHKASPQINMITSRGCPHHCLQGDTLIDTLEGFIPIKDLVGRTDVKVLTRDPVTQQVQYGQAGEIRKTRINAEMVQVNFDDGSFIKVTPDHKLMTFKNGNQFVDVDEREVEAKDLQPGQSVRAVKYDCRKDGYVEVSWGRHKHDRQHRLIAEGMLGRSLGTDEDVHHRDLNPLNNHPSNLLIVNSQAEHITYHPEVAIRMSERNPMHQADVRAKVSATNKNNIRLGLTTPYMCTPEGRAEISRIARIRALSDKNPLRRENRNPFVNHKVVSVVPLSEREDVYCMEVPGFGWFFANGVLVHNCAFCCIGTTFGAYRMRSPENVLAEIDELVKVYGVKEIDFEDDNLTVNKKRAMAIFQGIIDRKYNLYLNSPSGLSVASLDEELLDKMRETGYYAVNIAIESGSPRVLEQLMHKKVDLLKAKRIVRYARSIGIKAKGFFILGYPGETKEEMLRTVDYAYSCDLDWAFFFMGQTLPGTEIDEICRKNGYLMDPHMDYRYFYFKSNIQTPEWTAEWVQNLKAFANEKVNFTHNTNLRQGKWKEAEEDFQAVVDLYPDLEIAKRALEQARLHQIGQAYDDNMTENP